MCNYVIWYVGEGGLVRPDQNVQGWLEESANDEKERILCRDVNLPRQILHADEEGRWLLERDQGGQQEIEANLPLVMGANPQKIASYWVTTAPAQPSVFLTSEGVRFQFQPLAIDRLGGSAREHADRCVRMLVPVPEATGGIDLHPPEDAAYTDPQPRACPFVLPLERAEQDIGAILRDLPGGGWLFTAPYRNPPPEGEPPDSFHANVWSRLRQHAFGKLAGFQHSGVPLEEWPPLLRICALADSLGFRDWLQEGSLLAIAENDQQTLEVKYPPEGLTAKARAALWTEAVKQENGSEPSKPDWKQAVRQSERKHLEEIAVAWGWKSMALQSLAVEAPAFTTGMYLEATAWVPTTKIRDCPRCVVTNGTFPPTTNRRGKRYPLFGFLGSYFHDLNQSLTKDAWSLLKWHGNPGGVLLERWSRWQWGLRLFLPALQNFQQTVARAEGALPSPDHMVQVVAFLMGWMTAAAEERVPNGRWLNEQGSGLLSRLRNILKGGFTEKDSIEITESAEHGWRIRLLDQRWRPLLELLVPACRIASEKVEEFTLDHSHLDGPDLLG